MSVAAAVALFVAAGLFLVQQRSLARIALGVILLQHGVHLLLLASGGLYRRGAPILGTDPSPPADPLPQAFVLTSIVIGLGLIALVLTVAYRGGRSGRDDDLER